MRNPALPPNSGGIADDQVREAVINLSYDLELPAGRVGMLS
jgi:hypothetical protein